MLKTDLSLKYLEYIPKENQGRELPVLLFLHGRGANEDDLFDLAEQLENRFIILSVRAPLQLGPTQFAWFHTRYLPEGPKHNTTEAENARTRLLNFIREVQNKYKVPSSKTFLFGFSQGAMMSFGVALHFPKTIGGIAALSGRILPEHLPHGTPSKDLVGFPVFVSHGTEDEVVSIDYARAAQRALSLIPVQLTYLEHPMGHDVTDMNFGPVKIWLKERL